LDAVDALVSHVFLPGAPLNQLVFRKNLKFNRETWQIQVMDYAMLRPFGSIFARRAAEPGR